MAEKALTTFMPSRRVLLAGAALLAAPLPVAAVQAAPVNLEAYLGFLQAEVRNTLRAMGMGNRESEMPICWCPPAPKVHGTVESRARAILAREVLA
ncbi:MAG: hypothetical protein IOC54_17435 [Methylobacterium sp.]|nr:hypothetical protein [Methylobacterium sp.]MCA3653592.1 hypothetical protein [Methylobacterium sp.]